MRQSLNPLSLLREGFDWTGSTTRLAFILVFAIVLVANATFAFTTLTTEPPWLVQPLSLLAIALLVVPFGGHVMRRLNDLGWPGWFWFLVIIPVANLIFCIFLCFRFGGRYHVTHGLWRGLGGIISSSLAVLFILRIFWMPLYAVDGAMKPNLLVGDYVLISSGQYEPQMGDIIAFLHPESREIFVKRVVAAGGDSVQMIGGTLHINGVAAHLEYTGEFTEILERQGINDVLPRCENGAVAMGAICRKSSFDETLPGGHTHTVLNIGTQMIDDTALLEVPPGHYFVLGDNRDNSRDSRIPVAGFGLGFVPEDAIIGRADYVVFSSAAPYLWAFWDWRPGRFFVGIE